MQKDPARRLHAIGDVRLVLEGAFEGDAAGESRPAYGTRGGLPWSFAVLGILVVGVAAWHLKPAAPDAPAPVARFAHVLPEGQQFSRTTGSVLAIAPDGSRIVYVADGRLYSRTMDALESSAIPGTDENPSSPFFSPDGQWVGYWAGGSQLKKIPLGGGAPVTLADAAPLGSASWGADDMIVWPSGEGIMRVSANGGAPEVLIAGETLGAAQILPDRDSVLFYTGSPTSGEVVVQSLQTGERKVLFPGIYPRYVPTGHIVYVIEEVLFAAPFDVAALEVTGGSVPLEQSVQALHYAVSDSGSLVYVPGSGRAVSNGALTWVDRDGATEPLPVSARPYRHPRLSPDGTRLAVQTTGAAGQSDIWVYELDGGTQMQQAPKASGGSRPTAVGPPSS